MNEHAKKRGAEWVVWLILLSGCIFFGAMLHMELQAIVISLVFSLVYAVQGNTNKQDAPILIISMLVVQNLALGLGAHLGGNASSSLSYLTQIPFVTIFILFCSTALSRVDKPIVDGLNKWFLLLLLWSAVMFVYGGGNSIAARVVTLRNIATYFMAFCIAREFLRTSEDREGFYKQFGIACVLVSAVGFALMCLSFQDWVNMGIREVYIAKQAPITGLTDWGGRFIASITGSFNVLRMISTYYEPVNLAYLLSAGAICIAATWEKGIVQVLSLLIVGVGLVWTFGKGGWVVTGALAVFLLLSMGSRKRGTAASHVRPLLFILAASAIILTAYCFFIGGAVRPHFWGVSRTWGNVIAHPLGHGLGSGGNAAVAFGASVDGWLSTGGESALMSFAYQIGLVGAVLLLLSFVAISRSNPIAASCIKGSILIGLPYTLLGISLLQDNTFAPQCIAPFMLMLGSFSVETVMRVNESGN